MNSSYTYRTASADDWDDIYALLSETFNENFSDEASAQERGVFEPDRTVLAETPDGEMAGVSSAFSRELITPGGAVPASHVTMVSVSSTHRRRGILTNMITRLHADGLRRGEPVAVLGASEGRIYQRFGYGMASSRLSMEMDRREAGLRPDALPAGDGVIRKGTLADLDPMIKVFDRVYRDRPGWSGRDERWWAYVTADLKEHRGGATSLRVALHEGPSGVDGYLMWRVKDDWGVTPAAVVRVRELVAANPEAYRALWQHALSIDLTRKVLVRFAATDEPLIHLVGEPRALDARIVDSLWARILSVPDALVARQYAAPVDLVLEVDDRDIPANSRAWRLTAPAARPDGAPRGEVTCVPADAPADLRLDVSALGAAYLGGASWGALAAGGRVRELTPGAIATAGAAFGWVRQPSTIEMF